MVIFVKYLDYFDIPENQKFNFLSSTQIPRNSTAIKGWGPHCKSWKRILRHHQKGFVDFVLYDEGKDGCGGESWCWFLCPRNRTREQALLKEALIWKRSSSIFVMRIRMRENDSYDLEDVEFYLCDSDFELRWFLIIILVKYEIDGFYVMWWRNVKDIDKDKTNCKNFRILLLQVEQRKRNSGGES